MPVVTKYICDGCGKEKGPNNHWFRTGVLDDSIALYVWNLYADSFLPVYCGEACVLAAISKWMQERKEQDTETGKG